jgi:TolA-binding protein
MYTSVKMQLFFYGSSLYECLDTAYASCYYRAEVTRMGKSVSILFITAVVVLCAVSLPLRADDDLVVRFYVGQVTIDFDAKNKNKIPVVGNKLPKSAMIRTGKNSFIELTLGEKTIVVKERVVAKAGDVVKSATKGDNLFAGFRSVVGKFIEPSGKLAVASVRGEKEKGDSDLKWESDDEEKSEGLSTQNMLEREENSARSLYARGDYEGVVSGYESEWRGLQCERCGFYAALSYLKLCRFDDAKSLFDELSKCPDKEIAPVSVFYGGVACSGLGESVSAEKLFSRYLERNPSGEFAPLAGYLKGMALARLGKTKESRDQFEMVVTEYPSDSAAELAREALSDK